MEVNCFGADVARRGIMDLGRKAHRERFDSGRGLVCASNVREVSFHRAVWARFGDRQRPVFSDFCLVVERQHLAYFVEKQL